MARKKINDLPKIVVAYIPSTLYARPIIQEVTEAVAEKWIQGLLHGKDLIVSPTVLSCVYMIRIKDDTDENFNYLATQFYLHKRNETIGGDCFLVRCDFHRNEDGNVQIRGLKDYDIKRIEMASERVYQHDERLEPIL